jgi:D-amino peptidase
MSDMEGVSGISKGEQCRGGHKMYEEGRRLYTEEINAAVRGAYDGGATEVVVMDCHGAGEGWTFNSLLHEKLDERCDYVVQSHWTEYTEFLEQGCDMALFVGMHARAGTENGVLSHTVSGTEWHKLSFNGKEVGETAINAALCGTWDCPVALVTGDQVTCDEATDLLGAELKTVAVKKGIGRYSARHVAPQRARQLIEDASKEVVATKPAVPVYKLESPCEIEVELNSPGHAEIYRWIENVEITGPRTVVSRADDWWTAWKQIYVHR